MVEADSQLKLLPVSTLDIHKVFEHIDMLSMGIWQSPQTVIPTLLGSDLGVLAHLWSQNDVITWLLRLTATSNCFPHPHYTYAKCLSASICCPWAYVSSLKQFYPHYLGQNLGFWLTFWVKMMSFCHGWGWQPPQTASHIYIWHIKSVWAHWYAVHGNMVVASNSYTHPTWLRLWGSGSLVESKWYHYIMAEADSHLKLLPASTLDIYKVFQHIGMMPMGIWQYPQTVIPTLLGSDFRVLCSLVESKWCHCDMVEAGSHLKLLPASILDIYKVFEHIDMLSMGIWQ
jgi:hypothetical protein